MPDWKFIFFEIHMCSWRVVLVLWRGVNIGLMYVGMYSCIVYIVYITYMYTMCIVYIGITTTFAMHHKFAKFSDQHILCNAYYACLWIRNAKISDTIRMCMNTFTFAVKTNLVRWVTSEQIGKMVLPIRFQAFNNHG